MRFQRSRLFKRMMSMSLAMVMIVTSSFANAIVANAETKSAQIDANLISGDVDQIVSQPEKIYAKVLSSQERNIDFNEDWKFHLGDETGAQNPSFNDSEWDQVVVPHDYSIDQEYSVDAEGESAYKPGGTGWYRKIFRLSEDVQNKRITINFDGVYMETAVYLNGHLLATHKYGYSPFSVELPNNTLKFDGSENTLAVKVENKVPTSRWYSGSGIFRDVKLSITDKLHIEQYGVSVTTPNYTEEKKNDASRGDVKLDISVVNNTSEAAEGVKIKASIFEKGQLNPVITSAEETIGSIAIGEKAEKTITVNVNNPKQWNVWDELEVVNGERKQNLYIARVEVVDSSNAIIDTYETEFGFRYFQFSKQTGFSLNGKNMKLRGVCMHHDQGALGSEAWHRAVERQVDILIDMGCNSIRTSHNTAAKALVDICNEKGIILVEEIFDGWYVEKNNNTNDFSVYFLRELGENNHLELGNAQMKWSEYAVRTTVGRDKNAPSIVMWSLGNEIFNTTKGNHGEFSYTYTDSNNQQITQTGYAAMATQLCEWINDVDKTRPCTQGDNNRSANQDVDKNILATGPRVGGVPGVIGYNYWTYQNARNKYGHASEAAYDWAYYGSETASSVISRGVYNYNFDGNAPTNAPNQNLTSYDKSRVSWGHDASQEWYFVIEDDANAGEYVWTGFDYLGEPTPWNETGGKSDRWGMDFDILPKHSYFGIIGIEGFPKDTYYLYRSLWNSKSHTLHILPSWNKDEIYLDGQGRSEVVVYTDAWKVKLYLNDKEVGEQTFNEYKSNNASSLNNKEGIYTYKATSDTHRGLYMTFRVPYEDGELKAVAYDREGNVISNTVGANVRKTNSDRGTKLVMSADRQEITADGRDLSYITIDMHDREGNFVNAADPMVSVTIEGDGKILAMDNGQQNDHRDYRETTWDAFKGKLLVIAQSTKEAGSFTVKATAKGYQPAEVTVRTVANNTQVSTEKAVSSLEYSRIYYVKSGGSVSLPSTVKANYNDGTSKDLEVSWSQEDISNIPDDPNGVQEISGEVTESDLGITLKTKVFISYIDVDNIAALLNYSHAIQQGGELALPVSRPVIMRDGTILNAYFPVTWSDSDFDNKKLGTTVIKGSAAIFGKTLDVTASVRVSAGKLLQGDNIAFNYTGLYYDPDGNKEEQMASLSFLRDGDVSDKAQYWTAEAGQVLRIDYDTMQSINKIKLFFAGSMPTSDQIYLSSSQDGTVWSDITGIEVNNNSIENSKEFAFSPVQALYVKVEFVKSAKVKELELYASTLEYGVGESTLLQDLKIKGRIIPEANLLAGKYTSGEETIEYSDIEYSTRENASCTILPIYNGNILMLLESENHAYRGSFVIEVNKVVGSIEPNNPAYDFTGTVTATAASHQSGEEPEKAVDGNENTLWHTSWNNYVTDSNNRWIQLDMGSVQDVIGLRYLPRTGNENGMIEDYKVSVSEDGSAWVDAVSGSWPVNTRNWQMAIFDKSYKARYVKLWGIKTLTNTSAINQYMSARELRVMISKTDLFDVAQLSLLPEKENELAYAYTGQEIRPEVRVELKNDSALLQLDRDYTVSYYDNVQPNEAARVVVRGMGEYEGELRTTFVIVPTLVTLTGYDDISVTTRAGVFPELPGSVKAYYSDGSEKTLEIRWSAMSEDSLQHPGVYYIAGTVETESLQPYAKVIVTSRESNIVAEKISAVVAKGTGLSLPETVNVYIDGEAVAKPVQWNESNLNDVADGQVITVEGTVQNLDDVSGDRTVKAEANIRVIDVSAHESEKTNVALNSAGNSTTLPAAIAYYSCSADHPWHANDGVKTFVTGNSKHIWNDWESGRYHLDNLWWGVVLGANDKNQQYAIDKVSIGFLDEKNNAESRVTVPESYEVQYYAGPENYAYTNTHVRGWQAGYSPLQVESNWKTVTYKSKGDVPTDEDNETDGFHRMIDVTFDTVITSAIRIKLTPKANQWVGLEEVEAYGIPVGSDTASISSLTIGDTNVNTSQLSTEQPYVYPVTIDSLEDIPQISVEGANHAAVTLVPPSSMEDTAKLVVKSENGMGADKIYEIAFTYNSSIRIGEVAFASEPMIGSTFKLIAPTISGRENIISHGYQIKNANQTEWQTLDVANTIIMSNMNNAQIRYYVETSGGTHYSSNTLTVPLKELVKVADIQLTHDQMNESENSYTVPAKSIITFTGEVTNTDASYKDIVFTVIDGSRTGIKILSNRAGTNSIKLMTDASGVFKIEALIKGGQADGRDFVKLFTIRVSDGTDGEYKAVESIEGIPSVVDISEPVIINAKALPETASYRSCILNIVEAQRNGIHVIPNADGSVRLEFAKAIRKFQLTVTVEYGKSIEGEDCDYVKVFDITTTGTPTVPSHEDVLDFEPVVRNPYTDNNNNVVDDRIEYDTDYYYTGQAITPIVEVWDNGINLIPGVDYTVSYKNNKNAWVDKSQKRLSSYTGTYDIKKRPTIIISGKGSYTKKQEIYFNILPVDLSELVPEESRVLYRSGSSKPVPTIYNNGGKLSQKKDYTVDYKDDKAIITGVGNFTGEIEYTVISNSALKDISKLKVTVDAKGKVYKGEAVTLDATELKVQDGKNPVSEDEYTVRYVGNNRAGKATVIITAKPGSKYAGTVSRTFTIGGKDLAKDIFNGMKKLPATETFRGINNPITISGLTGSNRTAFDNKATVSCGNENNIPLTEGINGHYTATYKNNAKVGTASVTLVGTGKDGVIGKVTLSYVIVAPTAVSSSVGEAGVYATIDNPDEVKYLKGGAMPTVNVIYTISNEAPVKLTKGVDYSVVYKDNKTLGNAKAIVSFKGNYKGIPSKELPFTIVSKSITEAIMVVTEPEVGKKLSSAPKVAITDTDGKNLKLGKDYKLRYKVGTGEFADRFTAIQKLSKDIHQDSIIIRAEGIPNGAYTGHQDFVVHIGDKGMSLSSAKVELPKKAYNTGREILLSKSDVDNLIRLKSGMVVPYIGRTDVNQMAVQGVDDNKKSEDGYYICCYRANQTKGKMTVIVRGTGKYYGFKTITINIAAKDMTDMNAPVNRNWGVK